MSISLHAQNRAPSTWLRYTPDGSADICIANVMVTQTTLYTYFSVMNWNAGMEGGGYCGIQDHPDGKNFIFSLWDPSNHQSITAPYTAQGTQIANFGGEGTGLRSLNFEIGWEKNNNYTIVTRAWQYDNHTFFGYWSFDVNNQIWTHIVTMDYPVPNIYFTGGMAQFMEDWLGSGQNIRRVAFNNVWKRYLSSGWKNFTVTNFNVNQEEATANYNNNFDAGIDDGYFYMQTGGNTTPTIGINANINLPATASQNPDMPIGKITSPQFTYDLPTKTLTVTWEIDQSKSPQFSYEVALYDNSGLEGMPLVSKSDKVPHQRIAQLITPSLLSGVYTIKIGITDIFDQASFVVIDMPLGPKSEQVITFPTLSDKTVTDPPFELGASSSSGLAINYESTSEKIELNSNLVTLLLPGRATIIAKQNGNANFLTASSIEQSFCINPIKPTLTTEFRSGIALLSSNATSGNQWFINDSIIPDATDKSLEVTEPGLYKVQVSVEGCKSSFSEEKNIVITGGVPSETENYFLLYPNPSYSHVLIALPNNSKTKTIIVQSNNIVIEKLQTKDKQVELDVSHFIPGLYFVLVSFELETYTYRFIKE